MDYGYEPARSTSREKAMKNLVNCMARSLVDDPDAVTVAEVEGSQISILTLRVAKEDVGKVIGRQGRTIQAMRTIVIAASAKLKRHAALEIIDEY